MRKTFSALLAFVALSTTAAMAQTVTFTDVLDVAVAGDGTSVFSASYDPVSDQFLSGHATNIRLYNGTTGAFVSNLNITGITPANLGFFAIGVGSDGVIYAYENQSDTHDLWKWDNVADTTPTKIHDTPLFARMIHVLGTGASTVLAMTGAATDGVVQIFETADGVTYTEREQAAVAAKSGLAIDAAADTLWVVRETSSNSITKWDKIAGLWTQDTTTWVAPPNTTVNAGPMVYDNVNDVLFVVPASPAASSVYALEGGTGAILGQDTVTNDLASTAGYHGAWVAPTVGGGTLWMAGRGATATNLTMYKWTYTYTPAADVSEWSLY